MRVSLSGIGRENSFLAEPVIARNQLILNMFQQVIIVLLFISALTYLGWMIYRSFRAKSCITGCGKCGAVDFDKIEKQLNTKFAVEKDRS